MATSTPGGGQTNLGVAPNVAGLLCYVPCCIGLVFGIVAAIVEKQSRFVRFHAFQSLLLHGALIVICVGYQVFHIVVSAAVGVLGVVLFPIGILLGLACLAILVFMMIKANGGEEFELPVIGKMARQWV
jgi:uncharacterized membrane protein